MTLRPVWTRRWVRNSLGCGERLLALNESNEENFEEEMEGSEPKMEEEIGFGG